MPDPEYVVAVVREWIEKAENDLKTARIIVSAGEKWPTDTAAFHAQQCIEKYLKALLAFREIPFPKTHSLRKLIAILPKDTRLSLSEDEQDELTDYATGARYPGWGAISPPDAQQALAIARRVRTEIRHLLPKQALQQRKR